MTTTPATARSPIDSQARLRAVGVALLLVAPSVHAARRRMLHWRAWLLEEQSSMALSFEDPGSLCALAGVALLQAATGSTRSSTGSPARRSTRQG
jgi:hypothetical protein